jgi:hypothetical protein
MIKSPDISQFSFKEMFNDSSGKSDIHLFCGFLIVFVSCICFPYTIFAHLELYSNLTLAFLTIGGALLGISRLSKDKPLNLLDTPNTETPQPTENATN